MEVQITGKAPRCKKCDGKLLITSIHIEQPGELYVYYSCKKCKEPHGFYSAGGQLFWFRS